MPDPRFEARVRRLVRGLDASVGGELTRLREDAGLSRRAVALAAGVDPAFYGRVEDGREHPSNETLVRLGLVLGGDVRVHLYPNSGPLIRDRHQARMLEALLDQVHPRWQAYTEVAVRRPSRGWVDAVLHEPRGQVAVATELQSDLRRLEQLIRWSAEKAASLPSWDGWAHLAEAPSIHRLLIVRRTRATRETAATFARQLRVAHPAHRDDALAAITGTAVWPGPAMIWCSVGSRATRFVGGR